MTAMTVSQPERTPAVAPAELRNPTTMMRKPGLLLRLIGSVFFRRVDFPTAQTELLNTLHREGSVVYVLSSQSLLDYLYFNWAFLDRGLPLAVFGQGMTLGPFRTLGANLRRLFGWITRRHQRLSDREILLKAPASHQPVVIFLRKARAIVPWPGGDEDPLRPLVTAQADLGRPIMLVPIILIWERAPSKLKPSLWDRAFGDFDAPGRMRKLLNFVGNHRHAIVQTGDPLNLAELLETRPPDEDLASRCRTVRYELHTRFHQERRVIRGPVQKTSKQMRDEMLRPESFRRLFGELAAADDRSSKEVKAIVRTYLK
ncbi:MAG: glycerol-3-phosphate O-acyltransferase, partial [Myxococcota bacterium]